MCIKIPIELLNLFSQNSICQKWGWIIESYSKHSYWVYVYQNWYWIIEKFWTECMCIKITIELLNLFSQNSICQKWGWIIESYSKHSYWVYVYQNWYWIIEKFWTECMCIKITIELLNPTSRIVSVKNRVELLNHS